MSDTPHSSREIVLKAIAFLNGVENVPSTETPATGRLMLKASPSTIYYQLETSHIHGDSDNIISANLHLGIRGHNGPIIANLKINEQGELSKSDLFGNMEGIPLAILFDEISHNHIYVEVIGNDVIRGQLGLIKKNFLKKH
jgi:hypothetical protein